MWKNLNKLAIAVAVALMLVLVACDTGIYQERWIVETKTGFDSVYVHQTIWEQKGVESAIIMGAKNDTLFTLRPTQKYEIQAKFKYVTRWF